MRPACVPTFMTLAEDMSYNHGPMISKDVFGEFLAPYYRRLIAELNELDIRLIVDTDGDVTLLVPWLLELGVSGLLPLERQAGVDGMIPLMKTGGVTPSVDHQTPPGVSMEQYQTYLKLLEEYTQ